MQSKHRLAALAILGIAVTMTGCQSSGPVTQLAFETPEDAVDALAYVAETNDRDYARSLFGPEHDEFSTGDDAVDDYERSVFAASINRRHVLARNEDGSYDVLIGEQEVPFPAPIIEHEGRWMFDTIEGLERLEDMRIGFHELRTIETLRILATAQAQYRATDHDGDGVYEYAQRYASSPGKRDGLYWPTDDDEPNSPLGWFHARAHAPFSDELGYQGYFFELLTAQGSGAPGGVGSYLDANGNLVDGFAVLAYPAVYGETAIMTFLMAADGVVYEKDLGPDATATAGRTITTFDPGDGWSVTND